MLEQRFTADKKNTFIVIDGKSYFTHDHRHEYNAGEKFRSFKYNQSHYEYDEESGRYYQLVESSSLRPEMDGALVRRRISKEAYMCVYNMLLDFFGIKEDCSEPQNALEQIAMETSGTIARRGGLDTRGSDNDDFVSLSVLELRRMLEKAYELGRQHGADHAPPLVPDLSP